MWHRILSFCLSFCNHEYDFYTTSVLILCSYEEVNYWEDVILVNPHLTTIKVGLRPIKYFYKINGREGFNKAKLVP